MLRLLASLFGIIIILIALMVIIGWVYDLPMLQNPMFYGISMRFVTAICFILSGSILIIISSNQKNKNINNGFSQISLPILSLLIMLIMAPPLFSMLFKIHFGVENLPTITNKFEELFLIGKGMPAFSTTVCFILIAIIGLIEGINNPQKTKYMYIIWAIIFLIGLAALIGYIFKLPMLYFQIYNNSVGMAIMTAILMVLWSLGLILCLWSKDV